MLSPRLTLGRSPENDIPIPDNKCSRRQALIEQGPNGLVIRNLSETKKPMVNGQEVHHAYINHGSVVKLGNTSIRIDITDTANSSEISLAQTSQQEVAHQFEATPPPKKNKTIFYVLVFAILALLYLVLGTDSKSNKKNLELRTLEAQQEETQQSEELRQKLEEARLSSQKQTPQYIKAKAAYLKGFRDYQASNYKRAISEFQTALSLYPGLEIANEYLLLAQSKFDEKVQNNMFQARQFFERKQYKRAMASYKNVMILVNRPSDPTFKEAKAKFDECAILLKGAL